MAWHSASFRGVLCVILTTATLQAASVSRQQADTFARKIVQIQSRAGGPAASAPRRTPLTQDEVNSWFAYRAQPLLPAGLSQPQLTILGNGRVAGQAMVDLEAIGKRQSSGGRLDPWSLLGGRVPVTVTGVLRTQNGRGQFEIESAEVSGVPLPRPLLQELVSSYSRTPDNPEGVRLDSPFALPANIQQIEVAPGQAVVVQ